MNLSVIIPCFNEKTTIEPVVASVKAVNRASEIIIVDDGSTDGTRDVLQRAFPEGGDPMVRVILPRRTRAKGRRCAPAFRRPKATCC